MRFASKMISTWVSPEEGAELNAYAKEHGVYLSAVIRVLLSEKTGIHLAVRTRGSVQPETRAARLLAKNTDPEVRAALLKVLQNGTEP